MPPSSWAPSAQIPEKPSRHEAAMPTSVVKLSELLPEPLAPQQRLGSADVPTLGSLSHFAGECKPCAFLYTKGCSNGVECPFCHLCPPGEKKRRQKEKKDRLKNRHV